MVILTMSPDTEFLPYDGDSHRTKCFEWKALKTEEQRSVFFAEYGARWTEFARLGYFDIVRQTVIDPMHNVLLGELLQLISE